MIYKPEHVSDLESGAIVTAEVRPGDAGDSEGAAERVLEAIGTLLELTPPEAHEKLGQELVDGGYFALAEMARLQSCGIRTVVSDPHAGRRRKDASVQDKQVLQRASRATRSASGKALLRRRGEYVERAFCHVLDHGGLRRATLKGCENLSKRYLMGALSFNLTFATGERKRLFSCRGRL
jgi:transposase